MDSKHMLQYSAAKNYIERNEFRIKKSNSAILLFTLGIAAFILAQFFIKYYSCFNR